MALQTARTVSSPPRALLLVDALYKNGAGSLTLMLAQRWAPYGVRLGVLQQLQGQAELTPAPEVAVENFSLRPGRLRTTLPFMMLRLIRAARRSEVVLNSEIGIGLPLGYFAARLTRRPFVLAIHSDLDDALEEWTPKRLHSLFRWIHRNADAAICVAPALVEPVIRNGLPRECAVVVINGIDTDAVRRAAQGPGSLIADDGIPVVVATGRLAPAKATELLIEAHARLVADLPHRILLLNDGPELARLQQLTTTLGVESSVEFAGAGVSPLPSVAAAYLFCLPSRTEGLPLALLEAVALGAPCIAADCADGVRAALDGGKVGVLVPVNDVDALTAALAAHLRDPEPLRRLAARGPEHARTFDVEVMAQGWADVLRATVEARRAQRRTLPALRSMR